MPIVRTLSRYVLGQWLRIFVLATVGLPVVSVMVYLTDRLSRLLDRDLTALTIVQVGLYAIPGNTANMIPAAALFATVFTVGPLARNSEITAAKAGGVSFYRLVFPILVAATLASVLCFWVSEIAPQTTERQLELEKERFSRNQVTRYDFTYLADDGWTYSIRFLDTNTEVMRTVLLEHAGRKPGYPNLSITADSAKWNDSTGRWRLENGATHILVDTLALMTTRFAALELPTFNEQPQSLLTEPKRPEEMTYRELETFIATLDRSGNDTRKLRVDLAVKLALPAACLVIALFGAPLAMSNPRAGAAWGIAISLGTTVLYLLLINLSKAVGASGVIDPTVSAWVPNGIFLAVGLWLFGRVRT
ncbi:MAG: LptF/LptG family permease [Gemmatimonadales bacterium]|nr:LptF/LptG family permease [Gemmatimonadota bacterium]MDX2056206.1 LptF/LptG family permease [Gemmatimonadales bacterium]